jgi:delta24-sterol reductase
MEPNVWEKSSRIRRPEWLYAHAYYTEKEFNEIYNREEYDALRKKYFATYLPSVYDKVKVDIEKEKRAIRGSWIFWMIAVFWSIWPLTGLYGVYKVLLGGDYLLPKTSKKEQELWLYLQCREGETIG